MSRSFFKVSAAASLVIALSGCAALGSSAPSKPQPYMDSYSRAFNIARAGGISEAKDLDRRHITDNQLYQVAGNTMDLALPTSGAGMDLAPALLIGWLAAPATRKTDFDRDTFLAWMPAEQAGTADEARSIMASAMADATRAALDGMGYTYEASLESHDHVSRGKSIMLFNQHVIIDEAAGCPDPKSTKHHSETCYVRMAVVYPEKGFFPDHLGSGEAWQFAVGKKSRSYIDIPTPESSTLDVDAIMKKISANAPKNTFIFLAQNKELERPAQVLEVGEPLYFVGPEK